MKQKAFKGLILTVALLSLSDCTNRKKKSGDQETTVPATNMGKNWDYEKIREVRNQENAQRPTEVEIKTMNEDDADCVVMTKIQMTKSGASGCRPVDPRSGAGANSFCCPRSEN